MSEAGSLDGPDLGAATDLPTVRGSMTGEVFETRSVTLRVPAVL